MRYFGTKPVVATDEDAIAAERLMAIAGRFKSERNDDVTVETPAGPQEAPQAPELPS